MRLFETVLRGLKLVRHGVSRLYHIALTYKVVTTIRQTKRNKQTCPFDQLTNSRTCNDRIDKSLDDDGIKLKPLNQIFQEFVPERGSLT